MRKSNQPGSEFKETQHDSSDACSEPTAASEQKYSRETDETRRNRPMHFANDTQRPTGLTAHESGISYSFTEMEENFIHPETPRYHPRFSPPVEFYESDPVSSSSDEEFHDFDYCNTRPDPFHKRQVYRMKTRNTKLYRTVCAEVSPTQGPYTPRRDPTETEICPGHSNSLHQASSSANHANLPEFSHCQAYLPNQVDSRGRPSFQSSHHSCNRTNRQEVLHHQANSSPSANTRDVLSLHQDKNEKKTSHQTIRSSVHLQQQMQREETGLPERKNASSNRAVTTLPPTQQRIRKTADRSRQSHPPSEQRNQIILPHARRRSREEVCEVRNVDGCRRTRAGVCKETDTSQEYRTFARVLEKRF